MTKAIPIGKVARRALHQTTREADRLLRQAQELRDQADAMVRTVSLEILEELGVEVPPGARVFPAIEDEGRGDFVLMIDLATAPPSSGAPLPAPKPVPLVPEAADADPEMEELS